MQKSPSVSASPRKTPVVESPPRVYASSAASTPNTRASDVGASSPYPRLNGEASARQSDKGGADSEVGSRLGYSLGRARGWWARELTRVCGYVLFAVPQVALLRQEVARMQLLLQASESKVAMWEECMQQLVHCVMLSPDMNDIYKLECSTLLRDALKTVEQIQAVRFVDCSFPSVPSEVRSTTSLPEAARRSAARRSAARAPGPRPPAQPRSPHPRRHRTSSSFAGSRCRTRSGIFAGRPHGACRWPSRGRSTCSSA